MAIYLIRHGETEWNRAQRLQGTQDVPLNGTGLAQARRLASRFRDLRVSAVLSSPLARARETALIISQRRQWPVVTEDNLREIDHGAWTGMGVRTVARQHPDEHAIWRLSPDRLRPSTGETLQEAYRRAVGVLSRTLRTGFCGDVVVVSHGVINALLLCAVLEVPISRVWEFPQPNGAVNAIQFRGRRVVAIEDANNHAQN